MGASGSAGSPADPVLGLLLSKLEESTPGEPGGWLLAIAVSVGTSAFSVFGILLQKKANNGPPARWNLGDIALTPRWLLGFAMCAVLPVPCQVVAYSLAPMSLTTPLTGLSVAMNMVAAPRCLGERLQKWPDMPASVLILCGTILTTLTGSREQSDFSFSQLGDLFAKGAFMLSLAILLSTIIGCLVYMSKRQAQIEQAARLRPSNPNIGELLLPAVVAAGCGCLANVALKAVSGLLKRGASFWECLLWILLAGLPALGQVNYLNRGLRLYLQTIFFPVYSSLLVLANTVYGLIFYLEYEALLAHTARLVIFALGILFIMLGVSMFTLRKNLSSPLLAAEMTSGLSHAEMGSRRVSGVGPGPGRCIEGVIASSGVELVKEDDANGWTSIVD